MRPLSTNTNEGSLVCVLNLAGSVSGHREFANPQVDGLQGFGLLPPAELKRKRTSFLRAGESETHATHPHGRGCQRRALRFQVSVVSSPLHVVPAALGLSAPGTFGFHTTARPRRLWPARRTAPLLLRFPTHHVPLRVWFPVRLRAMQAGSARFPARRAPDVCDLASTVSHTPRHLAHVVSRAIACNASWFRTVSSSPRPGPHGLPGASPPGARCSRVAHPANARYLFGATFSSSQAHRKAKATRTSAPPAYPMAPTPRLLTTTPPRAEPPPMPRLKIPE